MNDSKSAFVSVKCKCPLCETEDRHRYVKTNLFVPQKTESDHHVVEYEWKSPEYKKLRPLNYLIWHCSDCNFCDEMDSYRGKEVIDNKMYLVQRKFDLITSSPNNLPKRMAAAIDMTNEVLTIETALALYIQAAYLQELVSDNNRQFAKLGRFYLRTAWLYREKKMLDYLESSMPVGFSSIEAFFASFREIWPLIPLCEEEAMKLAIKNYQEALNLFGRGDDIRRETETIYLLSDLSIRLGRVEEGLKYVYQCHKLATEHRQQIRRALKSGINTLSKQKIDSMQGLDIWLGHCIERAKNLSIELDERIKNATSDSQEKVVPSKQETD